MPRSASSVPAAALLRDYPPNSPQAIARVLALLLVTDARVDPRELAALNQLDVFARVGLPRAEFMRVARDLCSDLVRLIGDRDAIRVSDPGLIEAVIAPVDTPAARLLCARLLVGLVSADGELAAAEMATLQYIVDRWGISTADLAEAVSSDLAPRAPGPVAPPALRSWVRRPPLAAGVPGRPKLA